MIERGEPERCGIRHTLSKSTSRGWFPFQVALKMRLRQNPRPPFNYISMCEKHNKGDGASGSASLILFVGVPVLVPVRARRGKFHGNSFYSPIFVVSTQAAVFARF